MREKITKLTPSTKERPKPEKPADVINIESARKKWVEKQQLHETMDASSVLADALDLIRENNLTDAEIDALRSITWDEKKLLKIVLGLFEKLRKQDETINKLRARIKNLEQEKGDERQI